MNPKTYCSAFGCKRWTRKFPAGVEMLCRDHFQALPRRLRKLQRAALRRADKYGTEKDYQRCERIWRKCVDHVNKNVGMP